MTFADKIDPPSKPRGDSERLTRIVEAAQRAYYSDTHNLAEGAGAAGLAGALEEKQHLQGKRVGIVLTGGNVDREMYERVLAGTF